MGKKVCAVALMACSLGGCAGCYNAIDVIERGDSVCYRSIPKDYAFVSADYVETNGVATMTVVFKKKEK